MNLAVNFVIVLVALSHVGFLYLEMFLWDKPKGMKIFQNDAEFAKKSAVLAANQGLYNGFLAAGLIWSLWAPGNEGHHLKIFFLTCVAVAGIYGGYSVSKRILVIQALPAIIGLILIALI